MCAWWDMVGCEGEGEVRYVSEELVTSELRIGWDGMRRDQRNTENKGCRGEKKKSFVGE